MTILAFNGSPRKNCNTATLLEKALEGAASKGARTELINLFDLRYKGCSSCFACKLKSGKSYGRCCVKDDLAPIFEKVDKADALIFGSPIYFGTLSGTMHCFLERLFFQYIEYTPDYSVLFKRKIPAAYIFSMNVGEEKMKEIGYENTFKRLEFSAGRIFGSCRSLAVCDTWQFDDYSKYVSTLFDPAEKARIRKEVFPQDCRKAFELGADMAADVGSATL